MLKKYAYLTLLWIVLTLLASCTSGTSEVVMIPTLAVLPSLVPTSTTAPTNTAVPTSIATDSPSATWTPNLAETQLAQAQATNDAAQGTLALLLTANAVTDTPAASDIPSATLTDTLTPSVTPVPVVAINPQLIYARSIADLHTCASRECVLMAQLQPGEAVTANGTIAGDAIDGSHASWYRVEYQGQQLFVYSQLMTINAPALPTAVPVSVATFPPVSLPPIAAALSATCPDVHASCTVLTCAEAYACLAAGDTKLDRDKDGIPCESICGQ